MSSETRSHFFVGMWAASFQACGTVARFSPCFLDVQTNWALCADGDKRQAYGRGEEESGGSRSDVGKVESPGDPPGTTKMKRNVRFTGFSILLGNMDALTHSHTVKGSHTHWLGKKSGIADRRQMLLHFFYHSWENKLMDFTHMHTHSGIFKLVQSHISSLIWL